MQGLSPLQQTGIIFLTTRGLLLLLTPVVFWLVLQGIPDWLGTYAPWHFNPVETFSGAGHYFLEPWARWDSEWYLKIARQGYDSGNSSSAFFPLYPLAIAAFHFVFFGSYSLAGFFVSTISCLASFYLLFRLAEIDFGQKVARRAVLYLAVFPTTFFLQAIYTESLFLALSIGSLLAARRQRYVLAGAAGGLAALTRNTGILLIVPLAIIYLQERQWRWRRVRADGMYLLLVPAGLGVWMAYLKATFGNALLFASVQGGWGRQFVSPLQGGPFTSLLDGLVAAGQGLGHIIAGPVTSVWPRVASDPGLVGSIGLLDFFFAIVFVMVALTGLRRLPVAYTAYALLVLLVPLSYPHISGTDYNPAPLYSMPRFVLEAFPVFIMLRVWGSRKRWVSRLILLTSVPLLVFLATRFAIGEWVA